VESDRSGRYRDDAGHERQVLAAGTDRRGACEGSAADDTDCVPSQTCMRNSLADTSAVVALTTPSRLPWLPLSGRLALGIASLNWMATTCFTQRVQTCSQVGGNPESAARTKRASHSRRTCGRAYLRAVSNP